MAKQVTDEKQSTFLVAGIVVFSDKVIDADTREKAKEWMKMTQIGRMFEQEKQDAVNTAVDIAEARALIDKVESVSAIYGDSIDEVCRKMKISKTRFDAAKAMVANYTNALATS